MDAWLKTFHGTRDRLEAIWGKKRGGGGGERIGVVLVKVEFCSCTSPHLTYEIAGVNTVSLGGCLHSSKTIAKWAGGFHDELNGHVLDLDRDGLGQVVP